MKATRHASSKLALVSLVATAAIWALCMGTAEAAINAVSHGNFGGSDPGDPPSVTVTKSVVVGASADKLVLMTSSEIGTGTITATYGGVPMTLAVGNQLNSAIFYLDLSVGGFANTDH